MSPTYDHTPVPVIRFYGDRSERFNRYLFIRCVEMNLKLFQGRILIS